MVQKTFILDTCVIRRICEGESEFAKCLKMINGLEGASIRLGPRIISELERQGIKQAAARRILAKSLGADSISTDVAPDDIRSEARRLRMQYPSLHACDDEILAYVMKDASSTLVTCDRGLEQAAKQAGAQVVNPDITNAEMVHALTRKSAPNVKNSAKGRRAVARSARLWVGKNQKMLKDRNHTPRSNPKKVLKLIQKQQKKTVQKQTKSMQRRQMRKDHARQLDMLASGK